MRLPNADLAVIEPHKLHGYLLSRSHPIGRFKARFFEALGYAAERWRDLEADLREQHLTQSAKLSQSLAAGKLFTIRAILKGPNGQSASVQSVWFVPNAGGIPQFVTAYPGGRK